jgi:hypothetical protein
MPMSMWLFFHSLDAKTTGKGCQLLKELVI